MDRRSLSLTDGTKRTVVVLVVLIIQLAGIQEAYQVPIWHTYMIVEKSERDQGKPAPRYRSSTNGSSHLFQEAVPFRWRFVLLKIKLRSDILHPCELFKKK